MTTSMTPTDLTHPSTETCSLHEALARAQMPGRLGEAHPSRPSTERTWPARLGRRAEQAAHQARLALARAL
ncbi:hypothetical protein [Nocardioides sp. SYSU DS0663]|uniref:hypothetical protein n=1 Tax=Nocardioides sp. SYSU DS0663 TaxID=3416445 RepID=UPI003F4C88DA